MDIILCEVPSRTIWKLDVQIKVRISYLAIMEWLAQRARGMGIVILSPANRLPQIIWCSVRSKIILFLVWIVWLLGAARTSKPYWFWLSHYCRPLRLSICMCNPHIFTYLQKYSMIIHTRSSLHEPCVLLNLVAAHHLDSFLLLLIFSALVHFSTAVWSQWIQDIKEGWKNSHLQILSD